MARRVVSLLGPVLLAVFPAISLFSHNKADIELRVLWWPLALSVLAGAALFGALLLLVRDSAKASVLAWLVVLGCFYYALLAETHSWPYFAGWVTVVLAVVLVVARSRRDLGGVALVLTAAAAVMTVPQVVSIASYRAHHPSISAQDARLWPTQLEQPVVPRGAVLPDIYVIIPDDYARPDILKKYFHYDDSAFVSQLRQRGFVLSTRDRSPYSYSELNVAAMLNLDYLTNWPNVVGETSQDFTLVKRVSQDNRAARLLGKVGYDYVHLDTDEVTFSGGNPGISSLAPPDSFANLWLHKTVLRQFGGPLGFNDESSNKRFRASIRTVFDQLRTIPSGPRPKFVVFHTLLPHDPYLIGAHGESVTFPTDADHTGEIGMRYYLRQLEYLNDQLVRSVDQIRARAKTPPVIVIQADEGFEVNPDLVGEEATQDIRVKGLGAFSLPGHAGAGIPDPPNMVNTLRFVLNEYLGTHYPMLPTVSHLEGDLPYGFEEITVR